MADLSKFVIIPAAQECAESSHIFDAVQLYILADVPYSLVCKINLHIRNLILLYGPSLRSWEQCYFLLQHYLQKLVIEKN